MAAYRSDGGCWTASEAAWTAFGGLSGGNLGCVALDNLWGCMLATYMSLWRLLDRFCGCNVGNLQVLSPCWTTFCAVCWQPTSPIRVAGPPLGLYVANLKSYQGCWTAFGPVVLATYRSYGGCWTAFGAVCWQPTSLVALLDPVLGLYVCQPTNLIRVAEPPLGLYVGNLQADGSCWTAFGAVCWQPTSLLGLLDRLSGCMLGTYMSYWGC